MKKYNIAIVGIRGAVGQSMVKILKERQFPINELRLLSSSISKDGEEELDGIPYQKLTPESFKGIDISLFSPGAAISKEYAPHAVKEGCIVIDNTSQFRMDPDVPLVVPEINPQALKNQKGIIANPNCSTIQMVMVLKPLHDYAKIKRVIVSTYQSVSGAGLEAIQELKKQSLDQSILPNKFQHAIAFNLIPHIDDLEDNYYTKEEMKIARETKKIMEDDSIHVSATCVRAPVFYAHSESVNIETRIKIGREKAIELLSHAPGIQVIDDPAHNKYPLPLDAAGKDDVFVGRIREDKTIDHGLNLWIVADNLRKGAALNAIQIAEKLIGDSALFFLPGNFP